MADDILDSLPLPVLLALHEAIADPTEVGRERARSRALDAGFHIHCMGAPENERPPRVLTTPIPMEPAPDGEIEADEVFQLSDRHTDFGAPPGRRRRLPDDDQSSSSSS